VIERQIPIIHHLVITELLLKLLLLQLQHEQ
jgi:hypothetical protein